MEEQLNFFGFSLIFPSNRQKFLDKVKQEADDQYTFEMEQYEQAKKSMKKKSCAA
ncbi:hypothetical protein KHA80_02430 [Anaerobacillus sp. HL2]|nr:hypothetical protein KHA80_02430 [Anaerobacillus sp. HL2]